MKLKSVMNHSFANIPDVKLQRSKFNRSHGLKTTFDAGYLIPVFVDEALPGDTFNLNMTFFARMATPLCPILDNMFLESFFFAVPNRLLWTNWEKFNGAQTDPGDSTSFTIPVLDHTVAPISTTGFTVGSLYDYFGLPTGIIGVSGISALFSRGYNLCWNTWFRDENLQDSVVVDVDNGADDPADYVLLRRGKRADYFTSCLPWAQKDDAGTGMTLPLGDTAPVITDNTTPHIRTAAVDHGNMYIDAGGDIVVSGGAGAGDLLFGSSASASDTGLIADLSSATAATINQLRQAFQIQRLYERDARGGTRYIEIIRSHFGVISPDFRMQRPEYLGGGSSIINITPVPQTSETNTTPQGTLAGYGTVSGSGHGFIKSFTEHCIILGLVSVRADLTYQQGLNRMFSRSTRWDFYWPALSSIGEQAVLNKEIYCNADANDDLTFGYQERYAEYRYKPSQITGMFRSTYATPLDQWHLATEFGALPVLNDSFIQDNPPVDRVIATPTEPHFLFDAYFDLNCVRPMPVYSVPGLIDHF